MTPKSARYRATGRLSANAALQKAHGSTGYPRAFMSVRVRLTRVGSKKNPIWRVVVADQRSPRDGRFIETIGHYNPQTEPSTIVIDEARLEHWLAHGAQPTGTVKKLIKARRASSA